MQKEPDFHIGGVPIFGRAIMAPMSGYTDSPFRRICRAHGSAMTYTGLISEAAIRHPDAATSLLFSPEERPIAFNVIGRSLEVIEEICRTLEELDVDFIDVNLGCPAKKVVKKNQGAYLLKHPDQIARIIKRLTSVLSTPVTAKMRLGWDRRSRNYLDVGRIIEDSGAAMIAVHARTKVEGYEGKADWDAIAEVKQAVGIPVLGNGDVRNAGDIDRMIGHTGCDGVLIGRAALGNPWIFQRRNRREVTPREMYDVAAKHLEMMLEHHGPHGLILFRKHAVAYFKNTPGAAAVRRAMMMAETPEEFLRLLSCGLSETPALEESGQ